MALSVLEYIWVLPPQPREYEYRVGVFVPIIVIHVIVAVVACRVFGRGVEGSSSPLVAAVTVTGVLSLLWAYYQIAVFAKDGVWNPDVPGLVTASSENATASLEPPVLLAPYGGCVLLQPSRCCPNRAYFTRPNPELFSGRNLTVDEVDDVVCGIIDLIAGGLDLASSDSALYTPSSHTSKETCFASVAEAVCAFAFPRCTATCDALGPCLEVCDKICEEHVGLLPLVESMLANPTAAFRSVALASTESALGSCEDLPMADGAAWTPSAVVLKEYVSLTHQVRTRPVSLHFQNI